ncbi:hypothetical protein Snoj_32410 [Streptomyces nojiriensis]|uniref:Uncharacterized protein n=1 Tax=Streptomyces nojiriensis TaxID=66374 RepID=A0ABQ3SMF7_9ACTN|nr:hypothetical protein [Streptomyces nojiriensis]QTI42896.1 hypothetical protein JYK04_00657 [Streptomyces nojiriensis]GGS33431.1 hypothetical protein GCM10010205_74600 [Streptomyces nojiriensis]GHI69323.1 hypothetical protein Snoj_32410 [Streptomyces nojiriensis]
MARLSAAVHVQHPTTREWMVLEPGEEPAPELAAEITNPGAWESGVLPEPEDQAEDEGPPPFGFASEESVEPEPDPDADPESSPTPQRRRKTATT